ncbi:MAG: GTPase domain-containing protein, partial [Planctomycetes bacterium]|nr:GTPase domain-containing protein [Planctomycetota bacterium]
MKRKLGQIWTRVWGQFATPKVDDADLERCYQEARRQMPVPVFWLLGKAQSGKTSIIRALTGNTRAEIGTGIRPCTRTAQQYPFPSEENCILRFLDTRGLGEVDYDPTEDLKQFQDQAHLLIVVMKALDHAQQ